MNNSIKHLKQLLHRTSSFNEFYSNIFKYPKWYLTGLEMWTKKDLYAFYGQNVIK